MSTHTYHIGGMHCASCELVIEKKLLKIKNIKSADASTANQTVTVEYEKNPPNTLELNKIFKENGYIFSDHFLKQSKNSLGFWPVAAALVVIVAFLSLGKLGLSSFVYLTGSSSVSAFFVFGLIAGVSSCAALVGGLVLSLSKQWQENFSSSGNTFSNSLPHLMFNVGRVLSYSFFGGILGLLGKSLQLSDGFTSVLIVIVSVVMAVLALQMLGVRAAQRFQFALPKSLTRRIMGDSKKVSLFSPFGVGAMTFFLPCGFTIIAQGLAILSGNVWRGALIMGAFALGTFIPLMIIGISSSKLLTKEKWSEGFQKTAGLLILFFVVFNLNTQFNFDRLFVSASPAETVVIPATNYALETNSIEPSLPASEARVIKMVYTSSADIKPSTFEIKRGGVVRFEVEVHDNGSGCMSTIMIPKLFDTPQYLQKGKTLVMEFTPKEVGSYKITCAMGVPRGIINVVN